MCLCACGTKFLQVYCSLNFYDIRSIEYCIWISFFSTEHIPDFPQYIMENTVLLKCLAEPHWYHNWGRIIATSAMTVKKKKKFFANRLRVHGGLFKKLFTNVLRRERVENDESWWGPRRGRLFMVDSVRGSVQSQWWSNSFLLRNISDNLGADSFKHC